MIETENGSEWRFPFCSLWLKNIPMKFSNFESEHHQTNLYVCIFINDKFHK